MKYRHVVWDWNGTLLMDDLYSIGVMNGILGRRGLPPLDRDRYREVMGFPIKDYYARVGLDFEAEPYEDLAVEFIRGYEAGWQICPLAPEARRVLDGISASGLGMSVLSANREDRLLDQIRFYGLEGFFDPVTGLPDDYAEDKTYLALHHLARVGLPAREVVFIGDTLHDVEAARAMGCDCLLVDWGHNSRARLKATGLPVFSGAEELLTELGLDPAKPY